MAKYHTVPSDIGGAPIARKNDGALSNYEDEFDNTPFVCGLSKKWFFVVLNALAGLFHMTLFFATIVVTCNSDAKCSGPVVYTYYTNLTYQRPTATSGFQLVPKYEKNEDAPLHLVSLPLAFFALSCLAHFLIVGLAAWTNIYRDWLLTCQQPIRWIEYCNAHIGIRTKLPAGFEPALMDVVDPIVKVHSADHYTKRAFRLLSGRSVCLRMCTNVTAGSASVMFIAIAYTSGIRDTNMIVALFVLMFCTMTYGWVCEMLANRTVDSPGQNSCGEILVRLFPNFLGYVPYVTAYYIVIEQYMRVTADYKGDNAPEGRQMPWWVDLIVIGQCAVFSCFAIVSILQQIWSPNMYYIGEIIYIVLSFTSKGLLGFTLIFSVLQVSDFDDAFSSDN